MDRIKKNELKFGREVDILKALTCQGPESNKRVTGFTRYLHSEMTTSHLYIVMQKID